MFIDLGISLPDEFYKKKAVTTEDWIPVKKAINEAKKLGYNIVAINQVTEGKFSSSILDIWSNFPRIEKCNVSWFSKKKDQMPGLEKYRKSDSFTVLRRLTVKISDPSQNYSLTSKNDVLSSYDIVAICPETEKSFLTACSGSYEAVDMISLDIKSKLPYHIKSKPLLQAISNGLFFEIPYTPALLDSGFRRSWLSNTSTIAKSTRGKNLIITSGADNYFDLRSPYDATNLLTITGLNQGLAKQATSATPRLCLIKSDSRKYAFKSVVIVENEPRLNPKKGAKEDTNQSEKQKQNPSISTDSKASDKNQQEKSETKPKDTSKEPPQKKIKT